VTTEGQCSESKENGQRKDKKNKRKKIKEDNNIRK